MLHGVRTGYNLSPLLHARNAPLIGGRRTMTGHAILATFGSFVLAALATHATAAGQSPPGATLDFE